MLAPPIFRLSFGQESSPLQGAPPREHGERQRSSPEEQRRGHYRRRCRRHLRRRHQHGFAPRFISIHLALLHSLNPYFVISLLLVIPVLISPIPTAVASVDLLPVLVWIGSRRRRRNPEVKLALVVAPPRWKPPHRSPRWDANNRDWGGSSAETIFLPASMVYECVARGG